MSSQRSATNILSIKILRDDVAVGIERLKSELHLSQNVTNAATFDVFWSLGICATRRTSIGAVEFERYQQRKPSFQEIEVTRPCERAVFSLIKEGEKGAVRQRVVDRRGRDETINKGKIWNYLSKRKWPLL